VVAAVSITRAATALPSVAVDAVTRQVTMAFGTDCNTGTQALLATDS
jgi:hypothetical protein